MSKMIKQIRHRGASRSDTAQDGARIMHPQVLIERDTHNGHAASSHVANKCDTGQGAGGVNLVAIDDILVTGNKDAEDAKAKDDRGGEGRPDGNVAVRRPAHPEHGDGNRRGSNHGEPEAELGREVVLVVLLCFDQARDLHLSNQKDQGCGHEQTGSDSEEAEALDALRDAVDFAKNVVVAVEEGEENDVNDSHVKRNKTNNGLSCSK